MEQSSLQAALAEHLDWWGLRRFESDEAYFQWQRATLSSGDLVELNRLAEQKRASDHAAAEIAFYDRAADARILPVLYSQRFDYYAAVGPLIAERIAERIARSRSGAGSNLSVLDFGCGIGLLTTFYARQFPSLSFVGVDRSPASLALGRERAGAWGLGNIRFECLDLHQTALPGTYDLILSTQALLQAELDPGLPSKDWTTFERAIDAAAQSGFEERTGLGARLDHLSGALASDGHLILFEKTRQLARRVPFQRALAARGLRPLAPPLPIRYRVVEEVADDGPLYVLGRSSCEVGSAGFNKLDWDETPEPIEEGELYRCRGAAAESVRKRLPGRVVVREAAWADSQAGAVRAEWGRFAGVLAYLYLTVGDGFQGVLVGREGNGQGLDCRIGRCLIDHERDREGGPLGLLLEDAWRCSVGEEDPAHAPLYENHTVCAQAIWTLLQDLPGRTVLKTASGGTPDGGQRHVELGVMSGQGLVYLYQATTFDQRQLVLVERERAALLEAYYQELISEGTPTRR